MARGGGGEGRETERGPGGGRDPELVSGWGRRASRAKPGRDTAGEGAGAREAEHLDQPPAGQTLHRGESRHGAGSRGTGRAAGVASRALPGSPPPDSSALDRQLLRRALLVAGGVDRDDLERQLGAP